MTEFVNSNVTADSHYTIEVGNKANVNIQVNSGDVNLVTTQGDINMKSGRNLNIEAELGVRVKAKSFSAQIDGTWEERVSSTNTKTGKPINLN